MSGLQNLETKPTAKILPNGLIKYYDSFGVYQWIGFRYNNCVAVLKRDGYNVVI